MLLKALSGRSLWTALLHMDMPERVHTASEKKNTGIKMVREGVLSTLLTETKLTPGKGQITQSLYVGAKCFLTSVLPGEFNWSIFFGSFFLPGCQLTFV